MERLPALLLVSVALLIVLWLLFQFQQRFGQLPPLVLLVRRVLA